MSRGKTSKRRSGGSGSANNKSTGITNGTARGSGSGQNNPTAVIQGGAHGGTSSPVQSEAPYSEFSKILKHYNSKKPFIIQRGFELFMDEIPRPLTPAGQQQIGMFANEWFVFDFRLPNGKTVLRDYIDSNPDKLTARQLDDLSQAEQSNRTAEFWLNSVDKARHYLFLEDAITGEQLQVYDVSASRTISIDAGMVIGRVIQQNGQWYFAGNPLGVLPVVATERLREMLKGSDISSSQDKRFIELFCTLYCEPDAEDVGQGDFLQPSEPLSTEDANLVIEDLHKQYNKLRKKQGLSATWAQLKRAILYEDGQSPPLDVFTTLFMEDVLADMDDFSEAGNALEIDGAYEAYEASGADEALQDLPVNQDALVQAMEVFFKCWNLLPHKSLGSKSPNDLLRDSKQLDIEQLIVALDDSYDSPFRWYIDTVTMEITFVEEDFLNLIDECYEMPRNQALQKISTEASRLSVGYEEEYIVKWLGGYGDEVVFVNPLETYVKYGIMENYIETEVDDDKIYERLERAIRGKGAFRRFKDALADYDMLEDYYQFHDSEMRVLAQEWLEDNGFIVVL